MLGQVTPAAKAAYAARSDGMSKAMPFHARRLLRLEGYS